MGPFLGVTLVPQTEVRNIMIPIFHDMMDWEQRKNGNFKQVTVTLLCEPPECNFQMDKRGQQMKMAECAYVFVCVGGSRADG